MLFCKARYGGRIAFAPAVRLGGGRRRFGDLRCGGAFNCARTGGADGRDVFQQYAGAVDVLRLRRLIGRRCGLPIDGLRIGFGFTLSSYRGDGSAHRDGLSLIDENFGQHACRRSGQFHADFIGEDFGYHVVLLYAVAHLL